MTPTQTDLQPGAVTHVEAIKNLCDTIKTDKPQDTMALFGDLQKMATHYYEGALQQASQSFNAAQKAAGWGTLFIFAGTVAVLTLMARGVGSSSWISLIPGVTIQAISGLYFYTYRKATRQFESFHTCLERMGRYLLANSVCANIENGEKRDEARSELVRTMATAPMLSMEGFRDYPRNTRAPRPAPKPTSVGPTP